MKGSRKIVGTSASIAPTGFLSLPLLLNLQVETCKLLWLVSYIAAGYL